jgi:NTE family protein
MAINFLSDARVSSLIADIEGSVRKNRARLDKNFPKKIIAVRQPKKRDRGDADDDNREYRIANIVLQGGGVLGLAHAGFVTGLEKAGFRFAGIAGASAGAIMAMGMAVVRGGNLRTETHPILNDIIAKMPMESFIDGPSAVRRLIKAYLRWGKKSLPTSLPALIQALGRLLWRRGLNPGDAFENWLRGVFAKHGVNSIADLQRALQRVVAQLRREKMLGARSGKKPEDLLRIMAACVPIGVKFCFPADVRYLSAETRRGSPAALVRASMSIPLFFEPAFFPVDKREFGPMVEARLKHFEDKKKLRELQRLDEVAFLDGGIFSNLPVDAFETVLPDIPTIVVPLISSIPAKQYRRRASISSLADDIGAVAFMVRNQRDRESYEQYQANRDRLLLSMCSIDVGETSWLNFSMDGIEQKQLFLKGLERAAKFLANPTGGNHGKH